jgi:hypothetical protein
MHTFTRRTAITLSVLRQFLGMNRFLIQFSVSTWSIVALSTTAWRGGSSKGISRTVAMAAAFSTMSVAVGAAVCTVQGGTELSVPIVTATAASGSASTVSWSGRRRCCCCEYCYCWRQKSYRQDIFLNQGFDAFFFHDQSSGLMVFPGR